MSSNVAAIFVLLSILAIAIIGKIYFDYEDRHQVQQEM